MDLQQMLYDGRLDGSFPLPPDLPFTRRMAMDAGVSRRALERLLHEGLVHRPIKGVYVGTHAVDTVRLRAQCLRLVVPEDCVVVDRHAGWLQGAEMILAPGEHLHLRPLTVFRPSGNGRLRNDLSSSGERNLSPSDIVEIEGLRVSSPLRTAWDLGRVRWPDQAVAGLDSMLRLGAFDKGTFLSGIERFRHMRWITVLRAIAPLADGRSESPGESVLRLRCHEVGVRVVPQVEVSRHGRVFARLDLADKPRQLGFEYDGHEWHSSDEQVEHDRTRRADLAEDGWVIRAMDAADVFGRERACEQIIRQAAVEARGGRRLWIA
jgi:hypothetical protein